MTTTSIVTPLALTAGAGIYTNTAFVVNAVFVTNRASYESTGLISNLLLTINEATSNVGLAITAGTLANLKSIGSTVAGNYIPCLGDSLPSNLTATLGSEQLVGNIMATANTIMNSSSVFVQAFSAAQGYVGLTNQVIVSAINANNYLGPTFTNQNNLITGDLMRVNPALPAFGEDLRELGNLFDFDDFGTPAALLAKLSEQGRMINGTLPAVRNALLAQGLTTQDIRDLVNQNRQSLFNPAGLTEGEFDRLQKLAYPALTQITGGDLADVMSILGVTTANIMTMADLLDPVKIFPRSYISLTLPTPTGDILIYDTGSTNNSINNQINNTTNNSTNSLINNPTNSSINSSVTQQLNNTASQLVNNAVIQVLNSGTMVPVGCDQLAKIIPPGTAAANRAIQVAFAQVKNLANARLPEVAAIL